MTSSAIVTLVASMIALGGSLLSLLISTRLALRKERRQLLWAKELDRFFELEELAGDLVEDLASYRPVPDDRTELANRFDALARAAGRFGRYPKVRQAIRDLHNTLSRMFVAKREHKDERRIRGELDAALRELLDACDNVLGRGKDNSG